MEPRGTGKNSITLTGLPQNLGKCISRDLTLLNKLGWRQFVAARRYRKDLADIPFDHPAKRLLKYYQIHGVPVKVTTKPWTFYIWLFCRCQGVYAEFLENKCQA
jgi:hypothetical protein